MSKEVIELLMSNVSKDPVDLIHQVTCYPGSAWENPFRPAKSIVDQNNNYRKYTHYLANALFLKVEPQTSAYNKLLVRAENIKKLVFECTCFPGPCHLDALRIMLTKELTEKGFNVVSNQVDEFRRHQEDED